MRGALITNHKFQTASVESQLKQAYLSVALKKKLGYVISDSRQKGVFTSDNSARKDY